MFIGRDRHSVEPVILLQDAQGEEVAWLFDKDGIAGAREECAEQVEGLRRASGDHQLLRLHLRAVTAAEKGGERPTEAAVPLWEAVIEQFGIAFGEAVGSNLLHQGMGQEREVRLADAKVYAVCAAVDLGRAVVHGGGPPVISDSGPGNPGIHRHFRPLTNGYWPLRVRYSRPAA